MGQLHRLTAQELETLAYAAWHMRDVVDSPSQEEGAGESDDPSPFDGSGTLGGNGHGGWVELKMIPRSTKDGGTREYGPYKYRRRWVRRGGKLVCTSTYEGKA